MELVCMAPVRPSVHSFIPLSVRPSGRPENENWRQWRCQTDGRIDPSTSPDVLFTPSNYFISTRTVTGTLIERINQINLMATSFQF